MMNLFITGANRGIGLGFVKYYLDNGWDVWACYRKNLGELQNINSNNLHLVQWDVKETMAHSQLTDTDVPDNISLLINNAGIYGPKNSSGQSLESVSDDTMHELFDVDCVGALRVVQSLVSRVTSAKGIIANISSKMGSSADNTSGGCYAYRAAKAALVAISRSMAVDLSPHDVNVITLHPGWVRTDMTDQTGLIDIAESVAGMANVIKRVGQYEPGAFVAYNGELVPY
ncbi:MAG: SDR family oxidoreductase [Gammaproteobacteria bacterium]